LGDKFRPATSYLTVATKARDRYFDLDAVREPYRGNHKMGESVGGKGREYGDGVRSAWSNRSDVLREDRGGAPPLDYWEIPTQPYKGSHYATWPEALLVRPILAMCPEKVCRVCGEASRRVVGPVEWPQRTTAPLINDGGNGTHGNRVKPDTTLGWTDCGHDDWRRGVVLDPFAGSGTTLAVATGHGRDAIGIDLDERNADLARERVGMFLE
jgi:hypothetical protein